MVVFPINTGIRRIADAITVNTPIGSGNNWFAEDITIKLSNPNRLATIVVDFAIEEPTIVVEFTLNGGTDFVAFNNGDPVTGGQSRFIDVTDGAVVNFKTGTGAINLVRVVVSSVP